MNACKDCRFAPALDVAVEITGLLTDHLEEVSKDHALLIDDTMDIIDLGKKMPANPVVDQQVAYVIDTTANHGKIIADFTKGNQEILDIVNGPKCEEDTTLVSFCPKSQAILPIISQLMASINIKPKGAL